jgi:endonuclease III
VEPLSLRSAVATLKRYYGPPPAPVSRDPFRLVLWEQVAYLVSDAERRKAFRALQARVGLTPGAILGASAGELRAIARLGGSIAAPLRAARLRQSAELVAGRWNGDLRAALKLPTAQARRALAAFAMIGEPGADKILVFTRTARVLPLDSNGLRVLQRLGLVAQGRDYRASYRRAQEALAPELPTGFEALIAAYQLLRRHGQELCRRKAPDCPPCPLRVRCPSATTRM